MTGSPPAPTAPAVTVREVRLETTALTFAGRWWERRGAQPGDDEPGDARAPLRLLALHGFQDNAASFDMLAPLLLARLDGPAQLLALDLAGHGHSDWRAPGADYGVMDYVADVLLVLDRLAWPRCSLLGHSLGAAVAVLAGGALAQRFAHALLVDGFGPLTTSAAQAPAQAAAALAERVRTPRRRRVMRDLDEAVALRCASPIPIGPAAARLLCARGTQQITPDDGPGGLTWRADPRLALPSLARLTDDTVRAFVAAMRVPTLLVEADAGILGGAAAAGYAARREAHPMLTRRVLPGGHHLHMEEAAPKVAAACADFLRTHGATKG